MRTNGLDQFKMTIFPANQLTLPMKIEHLKGTDLDKKTRGWHHIQLRNNSRRQIINVQNPKRYLSLRRHSFDSSTIRTTKRVATTTRVTTPNTQNQPLNKGITLPTMAIRSTLRKIQAGKALYFMAETMTITLL